MRRVIAAIAEPIRLEPLKEARPSWLKLVKAAASAWVADYAPSMGAALSYYSVFSMAPLLMVLIDIAGLVLGEDAVWRAPVRNRLGGLWDLVRARLLSFGMVLGIAFLLMVSLVMGAAVSALDKWWSGAFAGWELLAQGLNLLIGSVLTTGVFAMIYKIMPRVQVQWRDVWVGAVVTALLFTFGRLIIGTYIGKSGVASAFGAAGSLIVVFVWVYYSAQIFLIGAEFTWVYAKTFGSMRHLAEDELPKTLALTPATDSRTGVPSADPLREAQESAALAKAVGAPAPVRAAAAAGAPVITLVTVGVAGVAAGVLAHWAWRRLRRGISSRDAANGRNSRL